jgi:hypothetical protein
MHVNYRSIETKAASHSFEDEPDDETKAREARKCGELNCRFCRKQFETKELLNQHQADWKTCLSYATREYIMFSRV